MIPKFTYKKILCLFSIFLMIFSLNLNLFVSADGLNESEAYWSDGFSTTNYFEFNDDNCIHDAANNRIKLNQSSEPYPFDYEHFPNNFEIFSAESFISETLYQFISPNLNPGVEASAVDKNGIAVYGDSIAFSTDTEPYLPRLEVIPILIHHFKLKVPHDQEDLSTLSIKWWHGPYDEDAHLDEVSLYLWDYNSLISKWIRVDETKYKDSVMSDLDDKADLSATFNSKEYLDSNEGYIDAIVVGKPLRNLSDEEKLFTLSTDYINLSITTNYGYVQEGIITSELINPTNIAGWDRVIWKGSTSSTKSDITIKVLDKNNAPIEGYEGSTSPIDISNIQQKEIKIQAILNSNDLEVTPYLNEWAVLYHKEEGFDDGFSNDYRIDDIKGLKSNDSKIELDSYYSNWPLFGKNIDNSRSYDGNSLKDKPDNYYWYSKRKIPFGGFSSPVVDEGKVYMASYVDKKIYAFKEDFHSSDERDLSQDAIDSSKNLYVIDSSLAISDDHIIFGTNELDSKNYIHALDKSNLKIEKWNYTPITSGKIGFNSAPVVYDGKVFITSHSANSYDMAILSLLNFILKGNSYIIGLDQSNGAPLWDEFKLPANSYSTPAIGDGRIYAACQNIKGSNLYAIDLSSGEEVWNTSIGTPFGIIGKTSPVYADGKVFVIANERESILSYGTNKLFAIDAVDGEVLWNKTISIQKINILDLIKGVYTTAPVSSPAYYDDTLFVLSSNSSFFAIDPNNGSVKWSYEFSNHSILSHTYLASPMVIGEQVYVCVGNYIYCFDRIQENNVKPRWFFDLYRPIYKDELIPQDIFSSPVFADGLIFVAGTEEWDKDKIGRLYAIGNYNPNTIGYIESTSVQVPNGYWWSRFNADCPDSKNNTVSFKILDSNGNTITNFDNLNGSNNNISSIREKKIKLYAYFDITNRSQDLPVLNTWSLEWVQERAAPEFNITNINAWVNQDLPSYSVDVKDIADSGVLSGIDNTSAKYKLYFISNLDEIEESSWISAKCLDPSGSEHATITAELKNSGLDIKELINISFMVSDLAGNTENTTEIPFRSDINKPSSEIIDFEKLDGESYTSEFEINVEASDSGGSDVDFVILKYRYGITPEGPWGNLIEYKTADSLFSWYFGLDEEDNNLKSGYYQIVSIAVDNASNVEDFYEYNAITVLYDAEKPNINNDFSDIESRDIPSFTINISDDFFLDELFFQLDSDEYWELIDDFDTNSTEIDWILPAEKWVDWEELEEHYIYFRLTDEAGNELITDPSNSPMVTREENSSKAYIDLSDFSELQLDKEFEISAKNIEEIDIVSAKLFYKFSEDKDKFPENWTQFGETLDSDPYTWNFNSPNGNGYYKLFMLFEDSEGLPYTSKPEIVNVAVFPLYETVLFLLLVFVSIIVSMIIIKKINKKKHSL